MTYLLRRTVFGRFGTAALPYMLALFSFMRVGRVRLYLMSSFGEPRTLGRTKMLLRLLTALGVSPCVVVRTKRKVLLVCLATY